MDKQKDFCISPCRSLFYFQAAARAYAGQVFSFGQMAMRSARARAQGWFFLLVKWLALRAGQSALSLRLIVLF
ncbi:MAG: hypothetical protein ACLR29_04595 [Faecalibacterium prausnitzii]